MASKSFRDSQPEETKPPAAQGILLSGDEVRKRYGEFEDLLIDRQKEIIGYTAVERGHLEEQVMTSPGDVGDLSVIDTSADYFLNLAENHRQELMQIHDALDRMRQATYGQCEMCGNEIVADRLRKLPYARLCIDDQSALEARNRVVRIQSIPKI